MSFLTMLRKILWLLAGLALNLELGAQALPGYLQDSRDTIVRSGTELCWHSGSWTAANAVLGCDGPLAPPVTRITAPPLVTAVPAQPNPAPSAPAQRCDLRLSLAGDSSFHFDETRLRPEAVDALERQLIAPLANCSIERIVIKGYADRLGSASYNQHLSQRRADAVAALLTGKGIHARLETQGMGASSPMTSCRGRMSRQELIACLAPDRRVTVEVFAVHRS